MTRDQMFPAARLDLEYPMSLGVYEQYAKAQQVVDHLADQNFPVQNVEIVGTELRSVERVTGRLTRGRIAAIIELGVGFNPELTGAENVTLYAAVMGLSRVELAARFDEIVAFADLGHFIDEPVKYYSSGMQARLAFSVAVCVDPDILLVDEVLAVGDQEFRRRCVERLGAFHARGGTLLVVTHDLESVASLCSRAVWVEHGRIRADGPGHEVLAAYQASA